MTVGKALPLGCFITFVCGPRFMCTVEVITSNNIKGINGVHLYSLHLFKDTAHQYYRCT